ncbi:MAG: hypothetical protein Q8865_09305 [Bacillota bacterium]|nr:hypothetical protein [Bacillota bacterium]
MDSSNSLNENIQNFRQAVIDEAVREKNALESQLDEIESKEMDEAENNALAESYTRIHREMASITNAANKKVSQKTLEIKKELLIRRDSIKQHIFDKVKANIAAYTNTAEYDNYFTDILNVVHNEIGMATDLNVEISTIDMKRSDSIKSTLGNVNIIENPSIIGGIIAYSKSLGKYINKTFNSKIDDEMEHFIEYCKFPD